MADTWVSRLIEIATRDTRLSETERQFFIGFARRYREEFAPSAKSVASDFGMEVDQAEALLERLKSLGHLAPYVIPIEDEKGLFTGEVEDEKFYGLRE